jgi:cobyrinic acid a,c-diamide synthase
MPSLSARIIVAGTHSGVGKTTVATGLMAVLAGRGLRVAAAKVGPDFIDPGYHKLATGRPSRSLDCYLQGDDLVAPLAAAGAEGCDVLVVEGVMGLFDGSGMPAAPGHDGDGSTAAVSRLLDAPVVLVVDASAMSGSVAALVHGFASFDRRVRIAGVVLNRVGSEGHAALLRDALAPLEIPVLGALPQDDRLSWRERHLGLVPVAEHPAAVRASLDRLSRTMESRLDLEALLALAASAPRLRTAEPPKAVPVTRGGARPLVAVCSGPAFSFVYPENLDLLQQAGAELALFDPVRDGELPAGSVALYAGGGFPEAFASEISANRPLLIDILQRVRGGLLTWAECGGLLLLCETLDGVRMAGVLAGVHARMTERLTIGYRAATTTGDGVFGPAGTSLKGHEFHRSATEPAGAALKLLGRSGAGEGGFSGPRLFASYLHQHLAAAPQLAERFVRAASARGPAPRSTKSAPGSSAPRGEEGRLLPPDPRA